MAISEDINFQAKWDKALGSLRFAQRVRPHTVVFFESINQGAHTIVPQLDNTIVQRRQDPGPLRMEGQALDPAISVVEACDKTAKVAWTGRCLS